MTAQSSSIFSSIPAGYTDAGRGGTAVKGEKISPNEVGEEASVYCEIGLTQCKDGLLEVCELN